MKNNNNQFVSIDRTIYDKGSLTGDMVCSGCNRKMQNEAYLVETKKDIRHRGNENDMVSLHCEKCQTTEQSKSWKDFYRSKFNVIILEHCTYQEGSKKAHLSFEGIDLCRYGDGYLRHTQDIQNDLRIYIESGVGCGELCKFCAKKALKIIKELPI